MTEGRGPASVVIVGGGMSGGTAAVTLREDGYRGRVVLISREPGVPFGRPPLSKAYLRSEEDLDGWRIRPASWYDEHDVERIGESVVASVDTARHTVSLACGQEIGYHALLIASGGRSRKLTIPGADLPGIYYLRTVADCDAIKCEAVPGRRAVVAGMGFIGCEVAASLAQLGVHVTGIFPGPVPLARVLGQDIGAALGAIHRANGVELLAGDQIAAFDGGDRVEAAVTASGARVPCDFAVAGIGIDPEVPAIAGPPIQQSNGILVDELCRATAPDVYAAGDVANHRHPLFGRVRVEHYNNAEKHGAAAARSVLGSVAPYDYVHTFWSDQYEHKLEYVGHARTWDDVVVRGSMREGGLIAFYLRDGAVLAAAGLDRGGDPELDRDSELAACARLVAVRARPAAGRLASERESLWALAATEA